MATVAKAASELAGCPADKVRTRTGPTGITLQVCFDGKYTTCLRDSQRLGWSRHAAVSFCDKRRAEGRIK
jgi:hypothetical protein